MNIVIVSAFRNSAARLDRYFNQVKALHTHAGPEHKVKVVAVEGDSTDGTYETLRVYEHRNKWNIPVDLVISNHGGPEFGSTEDPKRLSALTGVMKSGMDEVNPERDDVVLYIESDLIWHPHQVGSLIDMAYRKQDNFDIVAPMVWAGKDKEGRRLFYDIWGFRKITRFSPFYPYHDCLSLKSSFGQHVVLKSGIVEIDSAGSCLAFRSKLAKKVQAIGEEGLVSWCNGARSQGFSIGLCPQFYVEHP